MSSTERTDTIAAIATASGRGGIGIIRLSGPRALAIARQITSAEPTPRHAHYLDFVASSNDGRQTLDQGILLYFPAPDSFTGEDVIELQGHGGPVVLDLLLKEILRLGARLARPGEFSERAFLNDKIDLTQAEAIADLIDSCSAEAARSALRSLQGEFSRKVHTLVEKLTTLRIYVEAAIDFPEEEIDFIGDGKVSTDLASIIEELNQVFTKARQGSVLREGMTVVIAGKPNAGKSSLLNALAGKDAAIVTDIAGTTRDVLREYIHIEGMPLHLIDTAGLRDDPDKVEEIGIERAWAEIANADQVLLVTDSQLTSETSAEALWPEFVNKLGTTDHITLVRNQCDASGLPAGKCTGKGHPVITLSAKTGEGVDSLRQHLTTTMGYQAGEGQFTARRRHLDALTRARQLLENGRVQLETAGAGELLADDLYQSQRVLGEITGTVSADELLGHIFSSFCIGK